MYVYHMCDILSLVAPNYLSEERGVDFFAPFVLLSLVVKRKEEYILGIFFFIHL